MPRLAIQDEDWTLSAFAELEMNAPRDEKWELIGGRIWRMMTGGTPAHNEIVVNLATAIHAGIRARGLPCRVYTENVKVVSEASGLSAFPDVFVRCGDRGAEQKDFADPIVIVEVLSPSTRGKDMTTKATAYRAIPSLARYVLVDQDEMSVTLQTRRDDGWTNEDFTRSDDVIAIEEIGLSLSLIDLYAGVVEVGGAL